MGFLIEIKHFLEKPILKKFFVKNFEIELLLTPRVFPPSVNGLFVAENIIINKQELVADVGTGTGIIAITAAKQKGIVFGTDNNELAVELATKNASKNNVVCEFEQMSYLNETKQLFDVIVANLPQDIVPTSYQKRIGKDLFKTMSGGEEGNSHMLRFLDKAKQSMHDKTRLYVPVYTDIVYKPVIKKIVKNYSHKIIAVKEYEPREFVEQNKELFQKLNEEKKINVVKQNGEWVAKEFLFELKLK